MLAAFESLLRDGDLVEVERIELPPRPERRLPIPPSFANGRVGAWLRSGLGNGPGLWRHQSMALEALSAGNNIAVATGTASGKSLIFQSAALKFIEENSTSRIVVFYPLKALAADQLVAWRSAVAAAGLDHCQVAEIHGDILPDERAEAIRTANIILMTPDVCQTWLMRNISMPDVRRFLADLRLVVMDEAHVLEAVFGSHVAFLLRRLQTAWSFAQRNRDRFRPPQFIAASATIANPAQHLEALTGANFRVFDESEDGSPTHPRNLIHIALHGEAREVVTQICRDLLERSNSGSFIAFADSRQGVERIAHSLANPAVRPYRSGYEAGDRAAIERALRGGELRGVVSTSALELGINIAHFAVGLNLDVPISRKSFRQRIGRIGRAQPGAFAILAEPFAFRRLGSTFADYWNGSIEPSHLYLGNRFMQFAHARCLADELEMMGAQRPVPPANIRWPDGFAQVFEYARPGGARPREFDPIAQLGGDDPHHSYLLRNIGEPSFTITRGGDLGGGRVGTVNLQQAIREAYPGSVYLHLAQGWRVVEWRNTSFDRTIRVVPTNAPPATRPLIRTFVNAAVDRDGVVAGHYREGPDGFLAECQLQITERIEGYDERGVRRLYRDLRQTNPAMTPKIRDFRTTGVVLRIGSEWFRERGLKRRLADALRQLIVREYSISPLDVDVAAGNIALVRNGQRVAVTDAVAAFDSTYGSLRLTEPVFADLGRLFDRLERAVDLLGAGEDPPIASEEMERLREWLNGLAPLDAPAQQTYDLPQGWLRVLRPGSRVCRRDSQGLLQEIEIMEPEFFSLEGPPQLYYRYRPAHAPAGAVVMRVPDSAIERTGDEWSEVLWDPATGDFREEEEEEEN